MKDLENETIYPDWCREDEDRYFLVTEFLSFSKNKDFQFIEAPEFFCNLVREKLGDKLTSYELNQLKFVENKIEELKTTQNENFEKLVSVSDRLKRKLEEELDSALKDAIHGVFTSCIHNIA